MPEDHLHIRNGVSIPLSEIDVTHIRAPGPGGQNVNKVATAIHIRFDIRASSLSATAKEQLTAYSDRRINQDGVVVIKASKFRSQEKNLQDGLERLRELIHSATFVQKRRRKTKPSRAAKRRRLEDKAKRAKTKSLRARID